MSHKLRRSLLATAVALTGAVTAAGPAHASDGTSNTVMFAEAVHVDPAHHQLLVRNPAQALPAGCVFAMDSDAHTTGQLAYAETAIAHARLAGIPPDRIVNCWPLDRLLAWLSDRTREVEQSPAGTPTNRAD